LTRLTLHIEINAAATIAAFVLSSQFDLRSTYFLIAGIGGVNPEIATICSVVFARFAVQVSLQYEIDARELSSDYNTGYIPLGSVSTDEYPRLIYVSQESKFDMQH